MITSQLSSLSVLRPINLMRRALNRSVHVVFLLLFFLVFFFSSFSYNYFLFLSQEVGKCVLDDMPITREQVSLRNLSSSYMYTLGSLILAST